MTLEEHERALSEIKRLIDLAGNLVPFLERAKQAAHEIQRPTRDFFCRPPDATSKT